MSIKQLCLKSCRNNKPPWDSDVGWCDVGWWRLSKEHYCFSSISVSLSPAKSSQALWMFSHECINCARPSTSLLLSLFFLPHYCKMRFLLLCYVWHIPFTYYFNLCHRLKIFFFLLLPTCFLEIMVSTIVYLFAVECKTFLADSSHLLLMTLMKNFSEVTDLLHSVGAWKIC